VVKDSEGQICDIRSILEGSPVGMYVSVHRGRCIYGGMGAVQLLKATV